MLNKNIKATQAKETDAYLKAEVQNKLNTLNTQIAKEKAETVTKTQAAYNITSEQYYQAPE